MKDSLKRIFTGMPAVLSVLTALTMLTGCESISGDRNEQTSAQTADPYAPRGDYPAFTDPVRGQDMRNMNDIAPEDEDYGNIVCWANLESYPKDTKSIHVTIENKNPGKGFYFYMLPNLERLEDGEWVRLNYYASDYRGGALPESKWSYCADTESPGSNFLAGVTIYTDYIMDDFTAGDYRAVVYAGDKILYAPFTVTD